MKTYSFLEEDYEDMCNEGLKILGSGTEAVVIDFDDVALKIFNPTAIRWNTKKRMRDLSKLEHLTDHITLPIGEVYIDFQYVGFAMEKYGLSLKDFFNNHTVTDEEKIYILKDIKQCLIAMHDNNVIHGDLQLSNILINDNKVKITDINNMKFNKYHSMYFNAISLALADVLGKSEYVDIITFNYITYLLMNCKSTDQLENLTCFGVNTLEIFNERIVDNKYFVQSVADEQLDLLKNPHKKLTKDVKFLIDYIK